MGPILKIYVTQHFRAYNRHFTNSYYFNTHHRLVLYHWKIPNPAQNPPPLPIPSWVILLHLQHTYLVNTYPGPHSAQIRLLKLSKLIVLKS